MPVITVRITQQDIDEGRRRDNWLCPVCRALFRETGLKWVVEEATCYPLVNRNVFIPLPPEVITFVSVFDQTGIAQPFEFKLDLPAELAA